MPYYYGLAFQMLIVMGLCYEAICVKGFKGLRHVADVRPSYQSGTSRKQNCLD